MGGLALRQVARQIAAAQAANLQLQLGFKVKNGNGLLLIGSGA
jgi:hypothetical protein